MLLSVLFVLACEPKTQTETPEPVATEVDDSAAKELEARLAYLEAELEAARVASHVPGMAIAIVKDDELIYAHGFGMADLESKTPVTPETGFAIGSSTKAFSSTLAAMMVDEGKLGWDDPITKFLPGFALQVDEGEGDSERPSAGATVRDLLSHRSGFARMGLLWAGGTIPREAVFEIAAKAEPVAPFREEFHYNNVTYMAGSVAAAKAAGTTWEAMVEARLLQPLAMTHSYTDYASAQADPNFARGYTWRDDLDRFEPAPMRNIDVIGPAGSINSTVLDMSQWLRLQLGEGEFEGQRLVSAEALAETHSPQIDIAAGEVAYGMGWMLREWEGKKVVEHGGNIDGFAASVAMLPEAELGMVLLTNVGITPLQGTAMNLVFDALLTDAYLPASAPDGAEGGEDFTPFVGEYLSTIPGMKDNFEIRIEDGKLAVDVPGQTLYTLEPPDEDGWRYFEATDEVAVSFDTNDQGEVIALRMHQGGMSFELLREGVVLPPEVEASEVRELLGNYRAESGMTATVLISNGRLAIDVPGQMVYELAKPEGSDYHFRINYEFFATFEPGEGMTLFQPGATTKFTREADQGPTSTMSLEQLHKKRKSSKRAKAFAKAGILRTVSEVELINMGASGTGERWSTSEGQMRDETNFGALGHATMIVAGDAAWSESSFEPAKHLAGVELDNALMGLPHILLGDWREHYDSETLLRSVTRDEGEVLVIELRKEGLPPVELEVDTKTGDILTIRSIQRAANGLQFPVTTELSDYRTVGGLRMPYVTRSTNPHTGTTVMTVTEIERKAGEDPERFSVPPVE